MNSVIKIYKVNSVDDIPENDCDLGTVYPVKCKNDALIILKHFLHHDLYKYVIFERAVLYKFHSLKWWLIIYSNLPTPLFNYLKRQIINTG
jgi:hypothetical protein